MKTIHLGQNLATENEVKLNANALTTHTCVVGMTGSGKTAVVIGAVEELIRENIPTILLDIKGDLINVAMQAADFRNKMNLTVLTPGANHGESVNVLSGLSRPDSLHSSVSALLKIIGDSPDPLKSKTHAFLCHALEKRHKEGKDCTLKEIIEDVNDPPFFSFGALEMDQAVPKRTRTALSAKLNTMLVAPSFRAWREGNPLNIDSFFQPRTDGKTNVVIYSVAHLINDDDKSFAISILLNELLSWVRKQSGSKGNLRATLVIDECFGLLPPHPKNPPTKKPILTMLKQARAYGLGVILATQNPMDLDYKAMANCQTWIVGRLQTANDKKRVLDAITGGSGHDRTLLDYKIGQLQERQFMLVRPKGLVTFYSRDVSAELVGPMTPNEITNFLSRNHAI